ncbi:MAG TPA: hypothetical protein VGK49_05150 [Ilumatobacteraceae bacterium]
MPFVQIIEYRTSNAEEVDRLGKEWEAAAKGDTTVRRSVLSQDRNDPERFMNIVFFDSYEEAMENSGKAVTQEFAAKMMALASGEPTFHDLDVVNDVTL